MQINEHAISETDATKSLPRVRYSGLGCGASPEEKVEPLSRKLLHWPPT